MERLAPTLLVAAVVIVVLLLMLWGWRGRKSRQSGLAAPASPPAGYTQQLIPVPGMYVATTEAGQNLERISVHGLGLRTDGALFVGTDGVAIERNGVDDLFIPAADLREVFAGSGMIGKFVEKGGLIILRWQLGPTQVDTGFRPREHEQTTPAIAAIAELIGRDS